MRVLSRILALLVLATAIAIGSISIGSSSGSAESSSTDDATIADYRADFAVEDDGSMRVVEQLTVEFPTFRRGIFRFFDTRNPNDEDLRQIPRDITVTRDGQPEPFEVLSEDRGRIRTVKIGDPDVTIDGRHSYRISYRIDDVLTPDGTEASQFYWNLIPSGWQMRILRSTLTVSLPAAPSKLVCGIGLGRATDSCEPTVDGRTVTVTTGSLDPQTPVTLRADLPVEAPEPDLPPWPRALDPMLGRSPVLLGVVIVVALLGGGLGWVLSRSTYERTPPLPLLYAPPPGIGPAQAEYMVSESVDRTTFVATLMYAAERGLVELTPSGSTWTITGKADKAAWDAVDQVTFQVGSELGVTTPGATFVANPDSVSAGEALKKALASFDSDTEGWAKTSGHVVTSGLGPFGIIVLIIFGALALFLGAINPFDFSILAVIPGFFVIGAIAVGARGAGTKRTASGRDLWSKVGGFRRILSTPSAQERFDFAGRQDLYTSFLPWAVAFDCAEEWAKKYRVEVGAEPPAPTYFGGYTGAHTAAFATQMVDSFDSALSSAISSYQATQSSSSSGGGGGFSGGGGGGGGGGGSW